MRIRTPIPAYLLLLAACQAGPAARPGPGGGAVFETGVLRLEIGPDARVTGFIDRATGANHARTPFDACAYARVNTTHHPATVATLRDGLLTVRFSGAGAEADLRVRPAPSHLVWELAAVRGDAVEEIVFVNLPLSLAGEPGEPFAAIALALDLQANVHQFPKPDTHLKAHAYRRFGFAGAEAAVVAAPPARLRRALQEAVAAAPELPKTDRGGPFALDHPIPRGSYLFDFGKVTPATVDDWIRLLHSLGYTQLVIHGGGPFRFGDCRVNPDLFPRGREDFKAVVDRLHAAGITVGVDVYSFFLDKRSAWVSPVPDPRLAAAAAFTLATDLDAAAGTVPVAESTASVSTVTGFFVRNSVTLHVDDELIVFAGASKEPPYGFTSCTRGAHGTRAAPHAKGAKVRHLKEMFDLFVPDPETTLLEEVAGRIADFYNETGLDMLYLDALDGEGILAGDALGWHYGSKFVYALASRLKKPAHFEMSTFHHHLWAVRSRAGAWDHPRRSHKEFIDLHMAKNQRYRKMFLPTCLGWWAVKTWEGPQVEPTYPDDIEYLCAKALGTDSALALMGIEPGHGPGLTRLAEIFRRYETLRASGDVPEAVRARLAEPGAEFRLETPPGGGWAFRPVRHVRHKIEALDGRGDAWTIRNPHARQAPRLRIEALAAAGACDAPEAVTLADAASAGAFSARDAEKGVTMELAADGTAVDGREAALKLTATNSTASPRGAWAKAARTFDPPLNLKDKIALGVWVHGDGSGALLNFQLRSPDHLISGIGEHYVTLDFTGWRYVELVEPEGRRWAEHKWPYGDEYAIYRESIITDAVSSLGIWMNELPPGKTVTVRLGAVKAVPVVKGVLRDPSVTVDGKTITFPVTLETGQSLEFVPPADARVYEPDGASGAAVDPRGEPPSLNPGDNRVTFTAGADAGLRPRANVVVSVEGDVLGADGR
jgi:hypothetical protein